MDIPSCCFSLLVSMSSPLSSLITVLRRLFNDYINHRTLSKYGIYLLCGMIQTHQIHS